MISRSCDGRTRYHRAVPKKTLNLAVPDDLLHAFNALCGHYGHAKQKGLVLSAALHMFLEADPREQGRHLRAVLERQVDVGVQSLLAERGEAPPPLRLTKAAKERKPAVKPLRHLPPKP
jgi:hypothetical protein